MGKDVYLDELIQILEKEKRLLKKTIKEHLREFTTDACTCFFHLSGVRQWSIRWMRRNRNERIVNTKYDQVELTGEVIVGGASICRWYGPRGGGRK